MVTSDTLLVSLAGEVLIVGRKKPNQSVEIVNAFQGEEAHKMYDLLVTKKKGVLEV